MPIARKYERNTHLKFKPVYQILHGIVNSGLAAVEIAIIPSKTHIA